MVRKCERLRDGKGSPFSLATAVVATLTRLGRHDDVYCGSSQPTYAIMGLLAELSLRAMDSRNGRSKTDADQPQLPQTTYGSTDVRGRKELETTRSVTTLRVQNTKCKGRTLKGTEGINGERKKAYSVGWEVKKRMCLYVQKAATKVLIQEKRNPFPENVTMWERIHEGQNTAKVERWEMPTWCHMFNSTLTGSARVWVDDLPPKSVNSYDDLKKAFLANFLQQKKCIKDQVEIHHIKQREGESTEDFVQRFKTESRHVKGAPECMRIFRFMHGITNPELIKRLYDKILKSVDEIVSANITIFNLYDLFMFWQ
ncbi:reverse transcriptase domain-containing protein [Tanacetum coccineum]